MAATCALGLAGCGGSSEQEFRDIAARTVTLPDGTAIQAEVKADRQSQAIGMMYRDSLPKDHGMLFVYRAPVQEAFWMHNCKLALDMIWIDKDGKVLEIVPDAPPCEKPERECPAYGGHQPAYFVLELGGGQAKAHGVAKGTTVKL